jgi:LPS-assembly lipoprotein
MKPSKVDLHKRQALHISALVVLGSSALTIAGCGFKLRGSIGLPFKTVFVGAPTSSIVANILRRQILSLRSAEGGTRLLDTPENAQVVVRIANELREKEVLSFSTSGRQRDYELRLRVTYSALSGKQELLTEPTEIVLRRSVSTIDSQLTAKQEEDVLLYNEMQQDMVQQILSRLTALKVAQ